MTEPLVHSLDAEVVSVKAVQRRSHGKLVTFIGLDDAQHIFSLFFYPDTKLEIGDVVSIRVARKTEHESIIDDWDVGGEFCEPRCEEKPRVSVA